MKIYIDSDFKCHASNPDGIFAEAETDFFNGKCDTYIKGYRFIPAGKKWVREDGMIFTGEMIAPWKPYAELAAAQKQYEVDEIEMAELDTALLETTYQNLMNNV